MIEDNTGQNINNGSGNSGNGSASPYSGSPGDFNTPSNGAGDGGGGGVPLPSSLIGNGMADTPAGLGSWASQGGADPSAWDAAGNFIGDSSVTGAGGSALANILKSLFSGGGNNSGLQTLLKALAGAGGVLGGHALAQNAGQQAIPPQLTSLLNNSVNRQQYQNPLFQAVNSGVYQMLPNFAKTGNPGLNPNGIPNG